MIRIVDLDTTRTELRANFKLWRLDPSEWEIIWHEDAGRGFAFFFSGGRP